jgi:hypothetical protein
MQDRPTRDELLAAITGFLERDIMPAVDDTRRFHLRVALNALAVVRRELAHEDADLVAAATSLAALLPPADATPAAALPDLAAFRDAVRAQTERLCERIRRGDADAGAFRAAVLAHVRADVRRKLVVTNPAWLDDPASQSPADKS